MAKNTKKNTPLGSLAEEIAALASGSAAPLTGAVYEAGAVTRAAAAGGVADGGTALVDRRFEIGSVTKVLTGALLGIMAEAGEVDPASPVDEVLGEKLPWRDRAPSLVELASHQAGLPNTPGRLRWREAAVAFGWSTKDPWRDVGPREYRILLEDAVKRARVGEKARYSSMGIGLLGDALSRAAGTDFETLLTQRLLMPLGMTRTSSARPIGGVGEVVRGINRKGRSVPYLVDQMPAAGMIASTVDDLILFGRAVLGDGPAEVVAGLQRAISPVASLSGVQVGYCWLVADNDKGRVVFHNGGTWGSQAHLSVAPDRDRVVVLLSGTYRDLDGLGGRIVDADR